jgi:hypothetical protein
MVSGAQQLDRHYEEVIRSPDLYIEETLSRLAVIRVLWKNLKQSNS